MWHLARNGEELGEFSEAGIVRGLQSGRFLQTDWIWQDGMADWVLVSSIFPNEKPAPLPTPNAAVSNPYGETLYSDASTLSTIFSSDEGLRLSSKTIAGILALLGGWLSLHKFYLGYIGTGLLSLAFCLLTCGLGVLIIYPISLAEGLIYLTMSNNSFYQSHVIGRKSWF